MFGLCRALILSVLAGSLMPAQGLALGAKACGGRLTIEGALEEGTRVRVELAMGVAETSTHEQGSLRTLEPLVTLDEHFQVCPVVTRAVIEINGQAVHVPRKAFANLMGIREGRLWPAGGAVFLEVHGGTGLTRYDAVFRVVPEPKVPGQWAMTERLLRTVASPAQPWERTVFRWEAIGPGWEPCGP